MVRKSGDFQTYHLEWLRDPKNAAAYLNAAIENRDQEALLLALRNLAEAEGGMATVAEKEVISSAVSVKISAILREEYLESSAKRSYRQAFRKILNKFSVRDPLPGDEI